MAGIIAGASGQNAFGNATENIAQAAEEAKQAAMNSATSGGDLEGRGAALEGAAGSAGGGEVAGAGGMSAKDLYTAGGIFGSINDRQASVGRGSNRFNAFNKLFI